MGVTLAPGQLPRLISELYGERIPRAGKKKNVSIRAPESWGTTEQESKMAGKEHALFWPLRDEGKVWL